MDIPIPTHRAPTHAGEMLLEEFLKPMEISQSEFARRIGVSFQTVNAIVRGRSGVSAEMAMRFARFFNMSVGFWLNIQTAWDVYHAQKALEGKLEKIEPVAVGV